MKNKSGVTLIELLVVLSILVIALSAASGLLSNSAVAYKNSDAQWQIQQDARFAVQKISNDVRSAYKIDTPIDNGSSNLLSLNNGNIEIEYGNGVNKNTLYRKVNGASNIITNNVSSITFTRSGSIITITLTTKKPEDENEFTISTKLYSRTIH